MFFVLLCFVVALWAASTGLAFVRHYRIAKSLDLPVLLSPIGVHSLPWTLFQKFLIPFLEKLPFGLGSFTHYTKRDWKFLQKYRVHEKHGDVFAHVSPTKFQIYVADPGTADRVLARKSGLDKPRDLVSRMDVFGPSLATVDGETWQHQRRLTAPAFSEANCRLVWTEALRQTQQMVDYWDKTFTNGANTLSDDFMTLTLHVLCLAGFGLTYDFESEKEQQYDERPSYRDCFADILGSPLLMIGLPPWLKSSKYLPKRISSFINHREELRIYMNEMVQAGKVQAQRILERKGEERPNILSTLVLKSEQARLGLFDDESAQPTEKSSGTAPPSRRERGLTDKEILGNLFIFGFAGHETTAHTITYAVYLLAAHPEWQDWLHEEIDEVLGSPGSFSTLDYDEHFHKLVRAKSLMYETQRLYPLVSALSRTSFSTPVPLKLDTHTVTLPPRTQVFPNVAALHTHPSWGPDPLSFRPSRFLASSPQELTPPSRSKEVFNSPPKGVPKGAFNPWGDGHRACPGKKFATVEFAGVLVGLLWGWRLEVVRESGEGEKEAQERVQRCVDDSRVGVTLGMKRPEMVRIRRVRR